MGRGKSPARAKLTPDGLLGRLDAAVRALHPEPKRLQHDAELFEALTALYGLPSREIWSSRLEPFFAVNAEALVVLYDEHRALPEAEILDLIEAPLVLELLERDSARLRAVWPGPASSLVLLAAVAGRPIYHAA